MEIYTRLAQRLDSLPNGFPSTGDGSELRLLAKLFTPKDASLAILLNPNPETLDEIVTRTGLEAEDLRQSLKSMARRGLIACSRTESGLGFGLMPFVVGIYEMQAGNLDRELALLVEDYFRQSFGEALSIKPQFHRIIPVGESIRNNMEVFPYESASTLVNSAKAWGVLDCICRKQKALIGEACGHPLDVCMTLEQHPGAFDNIPTIHAINREEAHATLKRAANAGLVHSVSNNQQGITYICNCCTCSCGMLRGMASLGVANVIARSAFVNSVDGLLCNACETCLPLCQFAALTLDEVVEVNPIHCVGCGVCVLACPNGAMALVRRPEDEVLAIPDTLADWKALRTVSRGSAG
jgi:electron transport complex protein RnfB